ncbi:MAG: hypothetical protein WDN29_06890 [Methylovirgula sp.]
MKRLAQGRLDTGVPPMGNGDEIAEMSQRIQVFKDNAVEKARLEAAAEAARQAAQEEQARQEIETQKYIDAHNVFVTSITEALQRLSDGDLTLPHRQGLRQRIRENPYKFQRLDRAAAAGHGACQLEHDGDSFRLAGNFLAADDLFAPHGAAGRQPGRDRGGARRNHCNGTQDRRRREPCPRSCRHCEN